MPTYNFVTADVFTDARFGGNQLAVIPDARGLADAEMAAIAREFNYSESTFVLPPDDPAHTRRVRIFTPQGELPFAGHPTVGTAHVLAATGAIPLRGDETRIVFEEGVGPVPVLIRSRDDTPVFAQLSVAKLPEIGPPPPDNATLARLLALEPGDLLDGDYAPQAISCGVPFLLVPLTNRRAVGRARVMLDVFEQTIADAWASMVMVFAADAEHQGHDIRARMFAPGISIPEDPATGSACATLASYLAARMPRDGALRWVVEQGYEMGRPSILEIEADKSDGRITAIRVGGASVIVARGEIEV